MLTVPNILLIITATTTALMAGLFYAYSCSVNTGLAHLQDAEYLAAMQSINKSIQNALFFAAFFGTLLLLPISVYLHYSRPFTVRFLCLAAAALSYVIGVFGITVLGNVPLNETLAAFNIQAASIEEIARHRTQFEGPWNRLNNIRTIASTLSIILVITACLSTRMEE